MSTKDDIKAQLLLLKLDTRGNKSELKARLRKHLKKNPESISILKAAKLGSNGLDIDEDEDKDADEDKGKAVAKEDSKGEPNGKHPQVKTEKKQAQAKNDSGKDERMDDPSKKVLHRNSWYDYYLCFDVEATCEDGYSFEFPNEVIEFPVVLLDGSTFEIETVDAAPTFTEVLKLFEDFLRKHKIILEDSGNQSSNKLPKNDNNNKGKSKKNRSSKRNHSHFNSRDPNHHPQPSAAQNDFSYGATFRFVTDGPFDIRDFIGKQCIISEISRPSYFAQSYIDVRTLFRDYFELIQWQNLGGMLDFLGESFTGRQHSGICDARMVGLIAKRLALGFSKEEDDPVFSDANKRLVAPQWNDAKVRRMKGGCVLKANRNIEQTFVKMMSFKRLEMLESGQGASEDVNAEASTVINNDNIETATEARAEAKAEVISEAGAAEADSTVKTETSTEINTKAGDETSGDADIVPKTKVLNDSANSPLTTTTTTASSRSRKKKRSKAKTSISDAVTSPLPQVETSPETLPSPSSSPLSSPISPESQSSVTEPFATFATDSKFSALMNEAD
ncbi:3'-5' exoribonuclease 1 [Mortierella sp. AD011]|nr:3'-5' exoribonuclease 1 [Mortierella sp. AD010]KAF9376054.1 3'-5' exoribonuclease 1 [Mortierella sp. AD011]